MGRRELSPTADRRRTAWWPAALLGLAGLAAHAREILGERPFFRDFHQVYVPAKMYLAQRLKAGELPQWWPWDGGGSPLIPQPVFSVFHPTTLLYALLPFWPAFTAQNLCGTWLALFGAYVLARSLGLSREASVIAGGLYGLNGYVVCLSEHQFMKLAAGTMPWYLAALVVAGRKGRAWRLAPCLMMGLLLLAGDPQIAILSAAAGLVFSQARARGRGRALLTAIASPFAGAALAAVQLLPSLSVLGDTERGRVMSYERWSVEPRHLAGLLWPTDFGAADWVRSTIFGWAGLGLALASLAGWRLARRRRIVLGLWVLTVVSLWLALGQAAGLHSVARALIPIWSQLRYPMKSMVLACLTLSLLAGLGFTEVAGRFRFRAVALAAVAGIAGVATAIVSGISLVPLTVLAVALAAAIGLVTHRRIAAAVVLVQCVVLAVPLFLTTSPDYYAPPPIARALQADGVGLGGPYFERPFAPATDASHWAETNRAGAGGLGTSLGAVFGLPSLTPSMPGSSWRVLRLFDDAHREATNGRLGLFGVQDVVLKTPVEPRFQKQVIATDPDSGYAVVRLPHTLPRAYFVARAQDARSAEEAIEQVSTAAFRPGREIVIEREPSGATSAAESLAVPVQVDPAGATNVVTLRVVAPSAGFVVLNEAAFHGWTATVDGVPTPIFVANGLVRAVETLAGSHVIVFRFSTPGLRVGAGVSMVALVALLAAVWWLARRKPYVPPSSGSSGAGP